MLRHWMATGSAAVVCASLSIGLTAPAQAQEPDLPTINVGGVDGEGGSIKGVVKFDGPQRPRRPIAMTGDAYCAGAHEEPVRSELYVFGDDDTLQNVLVYVSKGLEGKDVPRPSEPAKITQYGCVYMPHVSAVVVNQPVEIHNDDPTLHNVNFKSKSNGSFNIGMPVKGMVETRTFGKEDMAMTFKCDVHPWMGAFMHVLPHPYFAVTQQDGTFEIKGLPAGEYELTTWHELPAFKPDQQTYKVTVTEGGQAEVTITYAPGK